MIITTNGTYAKYYVLHCTSQLSIVHWHEQISAPTLADAVLDLLVHSTHKIKLTRESMRKKNAKLM
jgi:DNA replication protein DnaC